MAASKSKAVATTEEPNRRGDIVRAAGQLFHEKGYSATTIRDIANAVGMRSGSPFYHFKTKHDMLRAVVLEGLDAIGDAVARAAQTGKSPRATFEAMLRAHLGQLLEAEGRNFAATLLHESRHLDPEVLAELVVRKDRYEAMWQKVLKDLKGAGLIADDSPVARLFLLGAMNWTVQWYRPEGSRNIDQLARQLADFVIGKPRRA
ncbi:TetR/AcrR family transcriptional regulator [Sulfuritalea hydrogenivorans]|jgi:AcrR family transcriptional regulator|uniref:Transcriptional regulator, tetR family protein n=1 Tax=Sulfuritalea hydrogenivorans sk43H TaxID=1223802 RepID=W0SAZ2_9PROT|nr:TetR/AcrR family transcriptional regulator [Sulfuritalea hydrogenivorans]MDK9713802.1 TetR/AcrR family transcriptional regulator [Sulfuritalea sp.]BAO27905.1 transcriptional regulator, tetR family protein [Sulfuritalea hydrogenivorans sk43H]